MKKTQPNPRSVPKQSDIIIHPDGTVSVSFLWSDFAHSTGVESLDAEPVAPRIGEEFCEDIESHYRSCKMCPKECGYNRVKAAHPRCGSLELRVGTWGITFGDEPEIIGSKGSGAIMLSSCPLSCPSCHNPEMVAKGHSLSLQEFVDICYQLQSEGAENIQILSPTVHMPKLRLILRHLKESQFSLPILFKSSGVENLEYLKSLEGLVDIYVPDFKYGPDSEFARRSGFRNYFECAKQTVAEMIRQVGPVSLDKNGVLKRGVLIRHVMAPLPSHERHQILNYLNSLKDQCLISITDNFVQLE